MRIARRRERQRDSASHRGDFPIAPLLAGFDREPLVLLRIGPLTTKSCSGFAALGAIRMAPFGVVGIRPSG